MMRKEQMALEIWQACWEAAAQTQEVKMALTSSRS
jgi:hypothetical protein